MTSDATFPTVAEPSTVAEGARVDSTQSICPRCRRLLDAELRIREGKVVRSRTCPDHARFEAVVYGDAERYLARRRYMREHRWTHAHLSQYLDEELEPGEIARAAEHLGVCPGCSRVLATLRRTVEALRSLGAEPEPGLADGVIERLRLEPEGPTRAPGETR